MCKFWPQAYQVLSLEICKARHNRLNRLTIITFRRCFFPFFLSFLFQLLKVADTLQNQCSDYYNCFFFEVVQKENISAWLEYFILPWEKKPWFAWWCAEREQSKGCWRRKREYPHNFASLDRPTKVSSFFLSKSSKLNQFRLRSSGSKERASKNLERLCSIKGVLVTYWKVK